MDDTENSEKENESMKERKSVKFIIGICAAGVAAILMVPVISHWVQKQRQGGQ